MESSFIRTRISLCFLVICLSGLVSVPLHSQSSRLIQRIQERGSIIYIAPQDYNYPFLYQDEGRWNGWELDILRSLAEVLDVEWTILKVNNQDEALSLLRTGEGDVLVSGQRQNLEDGRFLSYSQSYIELDCYILINRLYLAGVSGLGAEISEWSDDSFDFEIGTNRRSSGNPALERLFPMSRHNSYLSYSRKIDDLIAGATQLALIDEVEYHNFFDNHSEHLLFFRALPIEAIKEHISFGVYWSDRDFVSLINSVIWQQQNSGGKDLTW